MSSYNRFSDAGKKASFDEMDEAEDACLHNSNMLNLVSAAKSLKATIPFMEEQLKKLKALQEEIKTFASVDDNLVNTTEVKRLHGAEHKILNEEMKRTRW